LTDDLTFLLILVDPLFFALETLRDAKGARVACEPREQEEEDGRFGLWFSDMVIQRNWRAREWRWGDAVCGCVMQEYWITILMDQDWGMSGKNSFRVRHDLSFTCNQCNGCHDW
jgi:hypothetical protein